MMDEQWKPVVGFEGVYEVSDCGRVRSKFHDWKVLTTSDNGRGYKQVNLRGASIGVKNKMAKVYRLVAEAFIGPAPTSRHVVNHINGIKTDDRAENLEWITQAENVAHAIRTGATPLGEEKRQSKTTREEVRQMREMRQQGIRLHVIAEKFGLATSTVCQIVSGKWWKHAPLADSRPLPTDEWLRGENSPAAKLSENDVHEIRRLYATGEFTQKQLGKRFGVTAVSIGSVINGKTWAHVAERRAMKEVPELDGFFEVRRLQDGACN